MDYCVHVLTWNYRLEMYPNGGDPNYPPQYRFIGDATFEAFGGGWDSTIGNSTMTYFLLRLYTGSSQPVLETDVGIRVNGAGVYRDVEDTGPFFDPLRQPTPHDVEGIIGAGSCRPCYEPVSVPEPASLLLLATGLLGLAMAGAGRKLGA